MEFAQRKRIETDRTLPRILMTAFLLFIHCLPSKGHNRIFDGPKTLTKTMKPVQRLGV
jgi:hypothetical protein